MTDKTGSALKAAFAWPLLRQNILISLGVGTALNVINQGDMLLDWETLDLFKACLTYCVPFFVATYSAYGSLRGQARAAKPMVKDQGSS